MNKAHYQVRKAIQTGALVPQTCEQPDCTNQGEAHHEDYDQPLAVIWFCRLHHYWLHRDRRAGLPDPEWLASRIDHVFKEAA